MSEVVYQEGSWTAPSSRRQLAYRMWRPASVRAVLVVIHGFGEHSGRYESFAQALAEGGLCVAVPDLWAHGRSGGARGDLGSLSACVRDLQELTAKVFLANTLSADFAVFGHSFGGLGAIRWALGKPTGLRRIVIQSPIIELGFRIPKWKLMAAALLAFCWPQATLPTGLELTALSHDPAIIDAYRQDPLVHHKMSARTYSSMVQARDDVVKRARELHVPVLLLCGAADRVISVAAARQWFDRLGCEKRLMVFPDAYHELHHEPVRDEVARLVRDWTLASG